MNNIFVRSVIFFIGLMIQGLAAAIVTQAGLGAPPVATFAYVSTFIFPLSYGTLFFLVNVLFIILQFFVLGKELKLNNFLQIVPMFFLGFFVDIGMILTEPFKTQVYVLQILMLLIGAFTFAVGITLVLYSKIGVVPMDGLVRAISYKFNFSFGKVKTSFDVTCCIAAILLSLCVFHSVIGVREGTVIVSVVTGIFIELVYKIVNFSFSLYKKTE